MAMHSSSLAWRIPEFQCLEGIPFLPTEEPGSPWRCKESDMTEQLNTHI